MREPNGIQTAILKLHVIQGMNKMHSRLIQNLPLETVYKQWVSLVEVVLQQQVRRTLKGKGS